jgi:predicted GNAT superfamily acetyltransferase
MGGEAWDRATAAARAAAVDLRPIETLDDADRLLDVMIATWGNHQLLPREMIRALADSGNVPYGAWSGEELAGFVLGWTGISAEDGLHIHSHMLAALPDRRHRGVGYALKLAQRAVALDLGISLVRWTFDPLVSRNAHFNLAKLGATADRFLLDFYGEMPDALNAGERSDRLLVRWDLEKETPGVRDAVGAMVLDRTGDDPHLPVPTEVGPVTDGPALIRIPRDYHDLRDRDRALADAWRDATAEALSAGFDAGLIVTGYTGDSAYVLTRP